MAGGMGQYYEAYFWPFLLVPDFKIQQSDAMQSFLCKTASVEKTFADNFPDFTYIYRVSTIIYHSVIDS